MKAILRKIRISPKKANLIAGMVREKKVTEALDLLKFMPKKGADILYKVVHSAASNAKNNFQKSIDDLIITSILVTKGPTYKRSLPISRGRMHPINKRTSHITVEVGMIEETSSKGSNNKKSGKEKVDPTLKVTDEKKIKSIKSTVKKTSKIPKSKVVKADKK